MKQQRKFPRDIEMAMRRCHVPYISWKPQFEWTNSKMDHSINLPETYEHLHKLWGVRRHFGKHKPDSYWEDVFSILKYFEDNYEAGDINEWRLLKADQDSRSREYGKYRRAKRRVKGALTKTTNVRGRRAKPPRMKASKATWQSFLLLHPWYRGRIPEGLDLFRARVHFYHKNYNSVYWKEVRNNGVVRLHKHVTNQKNLDIFD